MFQIYKIAHNQINFEVIINTTPSVNKTSWIGTNIFISFFTPDKDVKVVAPVKFIERNEEIANESKSHPIMEMKSVVRTPDTRRMAKMILAMTNPLAAKYLEGIHGNNNGVKNAPARYAESITTKDKMTSAMVKVNVLLLK